MDSFTSFIEWVLGGLVLVIGFFLKGTVDRQTVLEEKVNNLHETYVKKDDFKEFKEELWHRFDELKEEIKKR